MHERLLSRLRRVFRSWTINTATALTLLGILQANIPLLELAPRSQGLALIVIGIAMALLRAKTTTSLMER